MLKEIRFEAVFGNERKQVTISQPHGSAAQGLQLYIGKYYCGQFLKRNGEWKAYLNDKSIPEFTSTDIDILIQIIEDSKVFNL